jgi:hypothetical protein
MTLAQRLKSVEKNLATLGPPKPPPIPCDVCGAVPTMPPLSPDCWCDEPPEVWNNPEWLTAMQKFYRIREEKLFSRCGKRFTQVPTLCEICDRWLLNQPEFSDAVDKCNNISVWVRVAQARVKNPTAY